MVRVWRVLDSATWSERLKHDIFQTLCRPRAAEAVAVGESSSHTDTDSNAETRFIAAVDARKPFGANGHGCAASGRSLALGRGFRSRGHQSNSLIPIVNCSSNEIFPMQVCRHTLPQFMSTNGVVVAALLSTYGRPRCRNLFQDRAVSLSDSSRVWVAASSILKSSSSKSTGFIK